MDVAQPSSPVAGSQANAGAAIEEPQVPTPMEEQASLSGEEQERRVFLVDLNRYMAEVGKPLTKIPIMGYKELDLWQLYKEVTNCGGFNEVVKNVGTWSKIWKRLGNFDPSITDSSFRLKKNYERYLLEYEYRCFPEHKAVALELEKQMQLKRSANASVIHAAIINPLEPLSTRSKSRKPTGSPKQPRSSKLPDFASQQRRDKKRASDSSSSEEDWDASPKAARYSYMEIDDSSWSREDLQEIDAAVATLQALKCCAVY